MKTVPVIFALLSCLSVSGIGAAVAQGVGPSAYAKEPLVVEQADSRYRMAADGTGVRERVLVARVQAESTLKQLGVLSIPFAAKTEHVEWVYARVKHLDGSVTETPVSGAMEVVEPVTREAPFYSDLKDMQLPVKDLRVGDRLEWKARIVRTQAEAPGEFWGQEEFMQDVVALAETVELEVPKGTYVNLWSPKYKPVESDTADGHVYRWESSQKKPTVGPEADAAKEVEKKRLRTADDELDEKEGKLPDIAWSTFKSWEAVGAWYRGMEGDRFMPDADVKAKVAQVTAGKTTELEKVQAAYGYVATQIHYIGVAFGVGRFQPHSAGDVLQNQYGDCKDKHTLLAAMLETLGLKPDAVLIGDGIRFNDSVPSPAAFNHVLTRVEVGGKTVWLDTTAEVAPYGMLTYGTRDREALVVPETGVAKVVTTPAGPPFDTVQTMDAVGTLDKDGVSNSKMTLTFRGDDEVIMRSVMRQISPAQYDLLAQRMCTSMNYAGTASHLDTSRPEDTTQPFTMNFDYKRVKGGDWDNYRVIPQLSPVALPLLDEKDPPVESVALGVPRVERSTSAMKLPDGWGVELPEAVHAKSPYANYDLTYRFEKGTLYATRRVEVLKEKVPVSDWKTYNKFVQKVENEDYVQLTHTAGGSITVPLSNGASLDAAPLSTSDRNAEAKRLLGEAYQLVKGGALEKTEALLDEAKSYNPEIQGLWSMYGYLDFKRGDLPGTVKNYQKELALHPSFTQAYPLLIQAQLALRERDDAKQSLRTWAEAEPTNVTPTLQLGQMEYDDGDWAASVKTASDALARTPEGEKKNERLELLEGRAQLKAGSKEEGHTTLLALLKATDNPDLMNDAAYELADAGLELPLAEQTTKAALDKMEAQSRTWTLDENEATLRSRTRMLQATWDTMGWVYFRDGKLNEAEQYVGASWRGRQDAEVGKHMGEIALAKGDKNGALGDYELAQATIAGVDLMGVHTEPGPAAKELMQRADALRKEGARSGVTDGKAGLQKMRTLPLGPAAGLDGVAEYKILVNAGAVARVEKTGKKELKGGEERLMKAKLSSLMPAGSQAQMVLSGMLNCHSGVCELVLLQ